MTDRPKRRGLPWGRIALALWVVFIAKQLTINAMSLSPGVILAMAPLDVAVIVATLGKIFSWLGERRRPRPPDRGVRL